MSIPVGSILDYTVDPNPSNGPHLDVKINRLYGDKGHVNPLTKPGLLKNIQVGKDRRPLSEFPITSGYGPRDTGIPGASRYHKGIDYGIDTGTELYWAGSGRYSPENTIGVIYTNDEAGNPYEVLLTHTQLAGAAAPTPPAQPVEPVLQPSDDPAPQSNDTVMRNVSAQEAVERALNYKEMSKQALDTEYDRLRTESPETAAAEGMKMHMAYFGKE